MEPSQGSTISFLKSPSKVNDILGQMCRLVLSTHSVRCALPPSINHGIFQKALTSHADQVKADGCFCSPVTSNHKSKSNSAGNEGCCGPLYALMTQEASLDGEGNSEHALGARSCGQGLGEAFLESHSLGHADLLSPAGCS